ncbi:MAG: hypothetical protein ACYC7D_01665 [Nitrososphaerales archaeon]
MNKARNATAGAIIVVIVVSMLVLLTITLSPSVQPTPPTSTHVSSTITSSSSTPTSSSSTSTTTSISTTLSTSSIAATSTHTSASSVTSSSTRSISSTSYTMASTSTSTSKSTTLTSTSSNTTSSATSTITGGNGSITVLSETLNGTTSIPGIQVDLRINGNPVASGFTPITFTNLQFGVQYGVVVFWYGNYYVRYINDSNTGVDLQRYDLVTLNQSSPSDTLMSMFEYVPPSQSASLNILAQFPNGTLIGTSQENASANYIQHSSGMWLTVIPPGQTTPYTGTFTGGSILPFILFNRETYTVQMISSYCGMFLTNNGQTVGPVDIEWSHWQNDSSTAATRAITLNGNVVYVAIYDQVTPAPCATTPSASSQSPALVGFASVITLVVAIPSVLRLAPKVRKTRTSS